MTDSLHPSHLQTHSSPWRPSQDRTSLLRASRITHRTTSDRFCHQIRSCTKRQTLSLSLSHRTHERSLMHTSRRRSEETAAASLPLHRSAVQKSKRRNVFPAETQRIRENDCRRHTEQLRKHTPTHTHTHTHTQR